MVAVSGRAAGPGRPAGSSRGPRAPSAAAGAAVRNVPVLPAAATVALVLLGCAGGADTTSGQQPNTLTDAERAAGWRLLFDGRTLEGWRGYGRPDVPDGWAAAEGAITRVGDGGDLITTDRFEDFELSLEWRIERGGNSGIFFRAAEGQRAIYHSAPEMQVLDDANNREGADPLTRAGANYGLHGAPEGIVRPAGEWNVARILVRGSHVEHWLNGTKLLEYELGSPEWRELVRNSKFDAWPAYGQAERGHIGLQDHGNRVSFRSIKIRELG